MPVNVQLDAIALADLLQESSDGLVLRRRTSRGATVGIGARVGGRSRAIPLVGPVAVDISTSTVAATVGLGVLAPHAVTVLGLQETFLILLARCIGYFLRIC